MDSAWEQGKLEAWKMPENVADWESEPPVSIAQPERIGARQSPASGARFVGQFCVEQAFVILFTAHCQKTALLKFQQENCTLSHFVLLGNNGLLSLAKYR